MKLPMLAFEIGFLGFNFRLLRTVLAIPVFIAIAVIIDCFFGAGFTMCGGASAQRAENVTS